MEAVLRPYIEYRNRISVEDVMNPNNYLFVFFRQTLYKKNRFAHVCWSEKDENLGSLFKFNYTHSNTVILTPPGNSTSNNLRTVAS